MGATRTPGAPSVGALPPLLGPTASSMLLRVASSRYGFPHLEHISKLNKVLWEYWIEK